MITNGDIFAAIPIFNKLINDPTVKLNPSAGIALSNRARECSVYYESVNAEIRKLAEEYGDRDWDNKLISNENGTIPSFVDNSSEKAKTYTEKFLAVMAEEADIELRKIPIAKLGASPIAMEYLFPLSFLFEEENN